MVWFWVTLIVVVVIAIVLFFMSVKIVKQYERGVVLRFGRLHSVREPGIRFIIPIVDVMTKVSLRIVTVPIQSQGIITQDNVSVGVSAVAYYRIVDPVKSVIAIENVQSAIDQIAQTTLRKVVGQHHLDETLAETAKLNVNIREILDETTVDWGAEVTLVELKDILLPDSMKRAMAKQAEAEREKRAKIIAAEGEALAAVTARRGVGHDDGASARTAAAHAADARRGRRRQEHARGRAGAADELDRASSRASSIGRRRSAQVVGVVAGLAGS